MLNPLVSISCITYNHVSYIRDAIEGFLMQKTDFPFEIIIHDDASTDGTAEIIKEYADKHKDLIIPILQTENQWSKGVRTMSVTYILPKCNGKYVAICEGDDYWTDPYKLQKQVDKLNEYPGCNICFHSALMVDETGTKKNEVIANYGDSPRVFSASEIIVGGGHFMPSTSIVFNKKVIENQPEWFMNVPVGDYFLQVLGSLNGGALYLNETMAIYRANLNGSWTNKFKNADFRLDFYLRQLETLDLADLYTKIYSNEFKTVKRKLIQSILKDRFIGIEARKEIYRQKSENLKFKEKFLWNLVYQNLRLHNFLANCKKIIMSPIPGLGLHSK